MKCWAPPERKTSPRIASAYLWRPKDFLGFHTNSSRFLSFCLLFASPTFIFPFLLLHHISPFNNCVQGCHPVCSCLCSSLVEANQAAASGWKWKLAPACPTAIPIFFSCTWKPIHQFMIMWFYFCSMQLLQGLGCSPSRDFLQQCFPQALSQFFLLLFFPFISFLTFCCVSKFINTSKINRHCRYKNWYTSSYTEEYYPQMITLIKLNWSAHYKDTCFELQIKTQ